MHVPTHILSPHKCTYIPFLLGRKEKRAVVPVPVRDAPDAIDAKLHLVGAFVLWDIPVFIPKQGATGTDVGPPQGQSQDYDLSEDGTGTEELLPHWRDSEGEEKTHLPV